MKRIGVQTSVEFMSTSLVRLGLGAASSVALLVGSAVAGQAQTVQIQSGQIRTVQIQPGQAQSVEAQSGPTQVIASLPTMTISTGSVVPADAATVATRSVVDPAAVADPAAAPAKPAAIHRAHRLQMQTVDTGSLSAPASTGLVGNSLIGHARIIEARATALRPAPLPDQDVDAPGPDAQTLASQQQASVAPSFYGNKDHFSGDGFSEGSNLEGDKNNRRKPGGGMSLSIPVQ